MMSALKNYIISLNIFEPSPDSNEREDEQQRRLNIISTRVYLVVLALLLFVLALFTWLSVGTNTIIIQHPTKDQFEKLPQDAQCPCSQISLSYGDFTSLQTSLHQVCSSDFISDRWIHTLFFGLNTSYFDAYDFRITGSSLFQALAGFCRLSQVNILQSISTFDKNQLISPQILSEKALRDQVETITNQFQLTISNDFNSQLELVREMTRANRLLSALPMSMFPTYFYDNIYGYFIHLMNIFITTSNESNCDCEFIRDCVGTSEIYKDLGPTSLMLEYHKQLAMTIPGLVGSCSPVGEALLSTLECFYNQTCVNELVSLLPTTETFTALRIADQSDFGPNTTIGSIVDHLMIENWMVNITYEQYYKQCAPISCTYSVLKRRDAIFVLLKLISSLGGLTVILGLIIPAIVNFIKRPTNREPTPRIPCKYNAI